jgi:hypothetical protein
MKYTFKLLTIFTFASLLSCSNDDGPSKISLVGDWTLVSYELIECTDSSDNRIDECEDGDEAICSTWEFRDDGTLRVQYAASVVSGTYDDSISDTQVDLCLSGASCYFYDMSISGDELTLTQNDPSNSSGCNKRYTLSKD